MKYIRSASDLHMNGFINWDMSRLEMQFLPKDPRDAESVLVLAGDISSNPMQLVYFITHVRPRFQAVQYIPGNHEYYGFDMDEWNTEMGKRLNGIEGVHAAVGTVQLDEHHDTDGSDKVRFISATLWGDGGLKKEENKMVEAGLFDFKYIQKNGRAYTVADMMSIHAEQRKGIASFLGNKEWKGRTVVVTHHMPSYSLCHPRFPANQNGGFAGACDDLIEDYSPDLWIHGHTHDTIDTRIGQTRIVCNPRGYTREWNTQFNRFGAVFIEV